MRSGAALFTALLLLPSPASAAYLIAVEQLQPETPYPGDTVVFKVTLQNEASWGTMLYAEVVSPDGVVYPVDTIRSRAGNYLPNTEYVSFTIPENALPGNYTLSLRSHDYIYNEASFYVFEKKRVGLYVETNFENNELMINITSPTLIRDLEVELLDQLPMLIEQRGNESRLVFQPTSYRPLGQSYRYFGDVMNASTRFPIEPLEEYVRIPVKLRWQDGEKLIIWSGTAKVSTGVGPLQIRESEMEEAPEAENNPSFHISKFISTRFKMRYVLPIAALLLIFSSAILWSKRRSMRKLLPEIVRRNLLHMDRVFEGESAEKWAYVEKCIMELKYSSGKGRIKKTLLAKELRRRLSPGETDAAVGYLVKTGELAVKDEHIEVKGRWQENL